MIRRSFRRGLTLGLLGGAVLTALKTFQSRRPLPSTPAPTTWAPIPDTTPVVLPVPAPEPVVVVEEKKKAEKKKAKKEKPAPLAPWVEPIDGACPATHPVKGKLTSKIFHVPGGFNYPRTKPDRCYLDAAAAEADGLRLTKR